MEFLKEIYCIESMYGMFKGKLQDWSLNQFEQIFTQWNKWNGSEYEYKCK